VSAAEQIREARAILLAHAAALLETRWVALSRPFDGNELGFVAVSDDVARAAGRIEQRLQEGPGWEAHRRRRPAGADDLAAGSSWPEYADLVTGATPVRSVLALPLLCGRELLGALLAYAEWPGHFTGDRGHRADLLGAHAGSALGGVAARVKAANLEVALRTNREIGTAVGIVMDRLRLTDDQSFDYLRELSQRRHLKLNELAERIVVTGEIPSVPVAARPGSAARRADWVLPRRSVGVEEPLELRPLS
jgi:GAF domain-containing protein